MLSCRYSGPGTVQYNRRFASADHVLELVSTEGVEGLPPLPLVPYAMSLSTTVIYRALHDGERDIDGACEDLRRCCDALDVLGQRWTSVRGVARLAKRLWRLINSGALHGLLDLHRRSGSIKSGGKDSGVEDAASTTAMGECSVDILSEHGRTSISGAVAMAMPNGVTLPQESRLSHSNEVFQRQLTEIWPGIDTCYSQIDWTFQDWFDYELPGTCDDVA